MAYLAWVFKSDEKGRLDAGVVVWDLPRPPEDKEELARRGRKILDKFSLPSEPSLSPAEPSPQ